MCLFRLTFHSRFWAVDTSDYLRIDNQNEQLLDFSNLVHNTNWAPRSNLGVQLDQPEPESKSNKDDPVLDVVALRIITFPRCHVPQHSDRIGTTRLGDALVSQAKRQPILERRQSNWWTNGLGQRGLNGDAPKRDSSRPKMMNFP
ncbi:unnamed protein product [Lactuca virosa]|uniref:Uncharacterized protein n=1 Tax=Lactuca virosa TaxID=75947 RepID=A0AAU9PGQ0_9ASTR|nr:unnamed protein product [Lactuca virosa]